MDRGVDSDQGAVEDADLTLKQAALLAGCSVKTLRRAIHGKTAPVLPMHYVDQPAGAQIMIRRADLDQWQAERAGQVTTLDNGVTTGQTPLDSVQPSVSSGGAAVMAGVVAPLVAELAAAREHIEDLARENGRLQAENERLRAAAEQGAPEPTPPPPAAVAPPDGPQMHESLSGAAGQGSDAAFHAAEMDARDDMDRARFGAQQSSNHPGYETQFQDATDALDEVLTAQERQREEHNDLWTQLAAKAAAVPEAVTQAFEVLEAAQPEEPPRRGLLARLFHRR